MFSMNEKMSEGIALLGNIPPASQGVGSAVTGWIPVANALQLLALVDVGVFGASATVDANIQQATSAAGAGAKAIGSGKAIVQMLAAGGNNVQALINLRVQELDTNNGYGFVQLTITVGVAATQIAGKLFANMRFEDESAFNLASVVQVV